MHRPPTWINELTSTEARTYASMYWAWLATGQRYIRPEPGDGLDSALAKEIRDRLTLPEGE